MSGQAPLTPERLLGKALILRAKLADALKKAGSLPAEMRTPPPPLTRESVYNEICKVWYAINEARTKAQKLDDDKVKLDVLEKAAALRQACEIMLARFEQAITEAARRQLLAQVLELKKEASKALTLVRLVPGVITA